MRNRAKLALFILLATVPAVSAMAVQLPQSCNQIASSVRQAVWSAVVRKLQPVDSVVSDDAVRLLSVPCQAAPSVIRIASMQLSSPGGKWMVRVECSGAKRCLPFYAIVTMRSGSEQLGTGHASQAPAGATPGERSGELQPASANPAIFHRGDRLLLVKEFLGMRLTSRGTSMGAGARGETIPIRRMADGRLVWARILDEGHAIEE